MADRRRVHHGSRRPVSVSEATALLAVDELSASVQASDVAQPAQPTMDAPAAAGSPGETAAEERTADDGPIVVREKSHEAAPMSLAQALYEMELVGHDFFLFVDESSHQPCVVYRRRGYDYGVIRLSVTV